jgi:hypothetical protein
MKVKLGENQAYRLHSGGLQCMANCISAPHPADFKGKQHFGVDLAARESLSKSAAPWRT